MSIDINDTEITDGLIEDYNESKTIRDGFDLVNVDPLAIEFARVFGLDEQDTMFVSEIMDVRKRGANLFIHETNRLRILMCMGNEWVSRVTGTIDYFLEINRVPYAYAPKEKSRPIAQKNTHPAKITEVPSGDETSNIEQ